MDNQDRIQNNEAVLPTQVLPKGYQLDDYIIENEIGSGGFGITYKAFDQQLNRYVAIKEYFPFNLAARDHAMHVSPKTRVLEDVDEYSWGLSRFIQEARTLALFEHASIIRVIRFIERNNTAYIIMDFADGRDVSDVIQKDGLLSVAEVKKIIVPIAEGLVFVHSAGMLHRDIKPGNIRVKDNGNAVLIDFGAARQAIGVRSQSISTILTPGYAPIEQYSTRGNQGPWTDIYALAAVSYVCLTGENLSHFEATERIRNDTLPTLVDRLENEDEGFLSALDWALSPEEIDRPQTVNEWLDVIKKGVGLTQYSHGKESQATKKLDKKELVKHQFRDVKSKAKPANIVKSFNMNAVIAIIGVCVGLIMVYMASNIGSKKSNEQLVNAPSIKPKVEQKVRELNSVSRGNSVVPNKVAQPPTEQPNKFSSEQEERDFTVASKINTDEAFTIYTRLYPNSRYRKTIATRR